MVDDLATEDLSLMNSAKLVTTKRKMHSFHIKI